jgi:hypothetical protein
MPGRPAFLPYPQQSPRRGTLAAGHRMRPVGLGSTSAAQKQWWAGQLGAVAHRLFS